MAFMNYKEGTGVRSRGDLTANTLPKSEERFTQEDLVKAAAYLIARCEQTAKSGGTVVVLRIPVALRLADALLETVNRAPHP